MKDAFNNELSVGDKVIYSVKGGGGTEYIVGTIEKLQPCKPKTKSSYYPPDRVVVKPIKSTIKFSKTPMIYASNVVSINGLVLECNR